MANALPKTVQFQVSDLIHPHPARVLLEMFQHLNLEGEVAAETSDGRGTFLVVRVRGVVDPIIVPRDRTHVIEPAGSGDNAADR